MVSLEFFFGIVTDHF